MGRRDHGHLLAGALLAVVLRRHPAVSQGLASIVVSAVIGLSLLMPDGNPRPALILGVGLFFPALFLLAFLPGAPRAPVRRTRARARRR